MNFFDAFALSLSLSVATTVAFASALSLRNQTIGGETRSKKNPCNQHCRLDLQQLNLQARPLCAVYHEIQGNLVAILAGLRPIR